MDHSLVDNIPVNALQFGKENVLNPIDIIVGLDFGTSTTKVVLRTPYSFDSLALAVPFGEFAHESLQYLLPTRVYILADGSCSLGKIADASVLTDIKIGLMDSPNQPILPASGPHCDESAITVATAYIALVFRHTRRWLIAEQRKIFGEQYLRWSCNIGLPAAVDDNAKLRDAFIDDVNDSQYEYKDEETLWEFDLIPEVVAEVAGYARSKFRNEGLHLLIDVGASTLDLCSFILHRVDGEDNYSILTADIGLLGAKKLHQSRIEGILKATASHGTELINGCDPGSVLSENYKDFLPSEQDTKIEFSCAELSFKSECENLLSRTFTELHIRRDPQSRWLNPFPVFFCGGASATKFYSDLIPRLNSLLNRRSSSINILSLTKPDSLQADINDKLYHRLAVAWGLSQTSFNIGNYTRPGEIDDVPPRSKLDYTDRYPGPEQM